jgi:hypothetical protein
LREKHDNTLPLDAPGYSRQKVYCVDARTRKRTWQQVMDEFVKVKEGSNHARSR